MPDLNQISLTEKRMLFEELKQQMLDIKQQVRDGLLRKSEGRRKLRELREIYRREREARGVDAMPYRTQMEKTMSKSPPQGCKNSGNTEVLYDGSCTVCHADQGERCIKETITFTFRNKAQQRAFHAKLKGRKREDHGAKG